MAVLAATAEIEDRLGFTLWGARSTSSAASAQSLALLQRMCHATLAPDLEPITIDIRHVDPLIRTHAEHADPY